VSSAVVTHIAGADILIGDRRLRQRCSWCGAVLLDYDLATVAVAGDDPSPPATWPVGRLVRVDGAMSTVLEETEELPDDACGRLDDEVTR
jgi:hypothetical protein